MANTTGRSWRHTSWAYWSKQRWKKGGVDGAYGAEPLGGQARGEGHGVLFGDAHVEEAVGEVLLEFAQAGAGGHGGGNADDGFVFLGGVQEGLREGLGEGSDGASLGVRGSRGAELAGLNVEGLHAVVGDGVFFGVGVAFAFLGDGVEEDGGRASA